MIGDKILNYEINAHLGQGGMGNVYRATDSMLGREVALKMLHPQLTSQPLFLERFKKEARVLAQLLHPNIAVIYNFIEKNDNHYMVMEYVEGANLDAMLKQRGALPVRLVVPIVIQALEGLQHAHRKNIFHRDIKPSNLMVTGDGILKLMDFGIAKVAGEQKMTQANKIVGTVEFMAPELIEGKPASVASDIYAMGATLYELLSGKLPFSGDTDYNLMQAILKQKVRPLEKLNASVPKPLSDIVMKSLEKNPANRYPDAKTFQQALSEAFPMYREIDMGLLKPAQQTVLINTVDGGMTMVEQDLKTALSAPLATQLGNSYSPASFKQIFEERILNNKKTPFVLAGIGAVFFLMILIPVFSHKKTNEPEPVVTKNVQKEPEQTLVAKNNIAITPADPIPAPLPVHDLKSREPVTPKEEGSSAKEKKPTQVKQEKNKTTTKPIEQKEEKIDKPAPVEKKEEPKSVYLDTKLNVALYLRENLENTDREKDIPISFSVTHAVIYKGVTIINQGAIAKGSISIGRIITAIEINEVSSANGRPLYFQSAHFHRKRRDLGTDRNFEALLKPDVEIRF